ncbi:MAG: hypothetical protein M3443_17390 [Actinomycetota bacterium]|nr:hypothetical protein [Actinomycetota bacterium]
MTTVLDPRPPAVTKPLSPAPRLDDLAGRRVLLFDNGKLAPEYGARRAIFDVLRDRLPAEAANIALDERGRDMLRLDLDEIAEFAGALEATGVDAVVLALVDAGVGMPTTVLAVELERRGIVTCTICEGPGLGLAAACAVGEAPFLPLVHLPVLQGADRERISQYATVAIPEIVAALTGPARLTAGTADVRRPGRRSESGHLDVEGADPTVAFTELMAGVGLGDGFPLVAPTPERVAGLLETMDEDPDAVVWPVLPLRGTEVVARDIAVVAAMAGARPLWMPVIMAAYRGMALPEFRLFQAAITTHPGGTLVLVSGPDTERLQIASGPGCLGPGYHANAAIGRAVALSFSFLLGSLPGGADLTIQGSPAEYSYCCAEDLAASPWPGLHADQVGGETTVTVLRCEGPKNVLDHLSQTPESLLTGVARACATIHSNNAYLPGAQTVVFLNPAHAALLAEAGWAKADVAHYLFEQARNPRAALAGRGISPLWPDSFVDLDPVPVAHGPEDFLVVVAGAPGLASQVAIPWGLSHAVTTTLSGRVLNS